MVAHIAVSVIFIKNSCVNWILGLNLLEAKDLGLFLYFWVKVISFLLYAKIP